MTLTDLRNRLEQEKGRLQRVNQETATLTKAIQTHKGNQEIIEQAQVILQTVAQQTQTKLESYVSGMVTSALEAIPFDETYQLCLEYVQRRGKTEADIYLKNSQGNKLRVLDAAGGGVANVVSFALRISLWSLRKKTRPLIVLDEPFAFLHSKEAHVKVTELLKAISSSMGLQIIMVTGEAESDEIISGADAVFRVTKKRGVSVVSQEKGVPFPSAKLSVPKRKLSKPTALRA